LGLLEPSRSAVAESISTSNRSPRIISRADANGFWAVEVRAGHDVIEVRRRPRELDLPLGATYAHPADNREKAKGRAIPGFQKSRLRIGGVDRTIEVDASAVAARFEVDLARGPAEL
jgi:hypothetical protein